MADTAALIVAISRWVDEAEVNQGRDPEALAWHRVAKVSEEAGEAIGSMIGWTGGNPRKGRHASKHDVIEELLDTAVGALGAVEHLLGHRGNSLDLLAAKVRYVADRAGLLDEAETNHG